jgi:hypothetical protein
MAPQTAKFFRQWVMLIEKYSRAGALMQAGIKLDFISAPSLSGTVRRRAPQECPVVRLGKKRRPGGTDGRDPPCGHYTGCASAREPPFGVRQRSPARLSTTVHGQCDTRTRALTDSAARNTRATIWPPARSLPGSWSDFPGLESDRIRPRRRRSPAWRRKESHSHQAADCRRAPHPIRT